MNIGESIKNLRKKEDLSQDQFAELFNITRQTVSNWENEKSYPDLEIIIMISDQFAISVDELLKNDKEVVKKIDAQKKKKNLLLLVVGIILLASILSSVCIYRYYEEKSKISFDMSQNKTYQIENIDNSPLDVQTGYFTLPKSGKVDIKAEGETDDGKLRLLITSDMSRKVCYQISGQTIEDLQTVYLDHGSYTIQIKADDYTEQIISLAYSIKVNN